MSRSTADEDGDDDPDAAALRAYAFNCARCRCSTWWSASSTICRRSRGASGSSTARASSRASTRPTRRSSPASCARCRGTQNLHRLPLRRALHLRQPARRLPADRPLPAGRRLALPRADRRRRDAADDRRAAIRGDDGAGVRRCDLRRADRRERRVRARRAGGQAGTTCQLTFAFGGLVGTVSRRAPPVPGRVVADHLRRARRRGAGAAPALCDAAPRGGGAARAAAAGGCARVKETRATCGRR